MNERENDKGGMLGITETCKWAEGFEITSKHTNSKCDIKACTSESPIKIFSIIVYLNGDGMSETSKQLQQIFSTASPFEISFAFFSFALLQWCYYNNCWVLIFIAEILAFVTGHANWMGLM